MAEKVILCGANAYEQKYYFNRDFSLIPQDIQDEMHIICVLFTEEVGGLITFVYDEEGKLNIETKADDSDYLYDEISSGLLVSKILREKQDLFNSLEMFYKVFINGEKID